MASWSYLLSHGVQGLSCQLLAGSAGGHRTCFLELARLPGRCCSADRRLRLCVRVVCMCLCAFDCGFGWRVMHWCPQTQGETQQQHTRLVDAEAAWARERTALELRVARAETDVGLVRRHVPFCVVPWVQACGTGHVLRERGRWCTRVTARACCMCGQDCSVFPVGSSGPLCTAPCVSLLGVLGAEAFCHCGEYCAYGG